MWPSSAVAGCPNARMLEHVFTQTVIADPHVGFAQGSLFGAAAPEIAGFDRVVRTDLPGGAWVDLVPGWLGGPDVVFQELVDTLVWRQHTVPMYERQVAEPRLTAWWAGAPGEEPLRVLADARRRLSRHYRRRFTSIGFNLYRDGRDSVAWHGDRLRDPSDAQVAILSVGEPRQLQLRPTPGCAASAGAPTRSFALGDGTLLVMGGTCQATWQHAVPKTARHAGPRLSITFRHGSIGRRPYGNRAPAGRVAV